LSIENELTEFISRNVVPEGGVTESEALISSGKVDSLGLLQILGFIEEKYGVTLLTSGSPKDFESVQSLAGAIRKARGE
jgi:acyl carrier protein